MFSKFVLFTTFAASTLAIEPHQVNSLQHVQSAPTLFKVSPVYAAQATPVYAAPVIPAVAKYASPFTSSYINPSTSPLYSAPSLVNYDSPSASTYLNVPVAASSVYASSPVAYAAPVFKYGAAPAYSTHHQEEYAHPKYEYAYSIEDYHTGDSHSQQEQRDGDHVVGQYSLHEADGTLRIVKYSDDGHGFNAIVEKQGTPTEAPVALKKVLIPGAASHY